ncbi:hypothetical protein CPLU01_16027, partial [Colletotrichum plurivorum]
ITDWRQEQTPPTIQHRAPTEGQDDARRSALGGRVDRGDTSYRTVIGQRKRKRPSSAQPGLPVRCRTPPSKTGKDCSERLIQHGSKPDPSWSHLQARTQPLTIDPQHAPADL